MRDMSLNKSNMFSCFNHKSLVLKTTSTLLQQMNGYLEKQMAIYLIYKHHQRPRICIEQNKSKTVKYLMENNLYQNHTSNQRLHILIAY